MKKLDTLVEKLNDMQFKLSGMDEVIKALNKDAFNEFHAGRMLIAEATSKLEAMRV